MGLQSVRYCISKEIDVNVTRLEPSSLSIYSLGLARRANKPTIRATRFAERARGDYREGRDAAQRRATFLTRWRTRIAYAAHTAVIRCVQERARRSLVQSMHLQR